MGTFKRLVPVAVALLLKIGITVAFYCYPGRELLNIEENEGLRCFTFVDIILFVLTMVHFITASTMDPGIFPRVPPEEVVEDDLMPLYKNININNVAVQMKWCSTCKFYRPPRSSHCSVCDNCVQDFDHHCPWLGNCIGRRNYRFFCWYLATLFWIQKLYALFFYFRIVFKFVSSKKTLHMVFTFTCSLVYIFVAKKDEDFSATKKEVVISIIICSLVFLLFLFVCGLTMFHTYLITNGRTTYEQFSARYPKESPFDQGCSFNWHRTFCNSIPPSVINNLPSFQVTNPHAFHDGETNGRAKNYIVRKDHNTSQVVKLIGNEQIESVSIGSCNDIGHSEMDLRASQSQGNLSLANLPNGIAVSIQNLAVQTQKSGLVCSLPEAEEYTNANANSKQDDIGTGHRDLL
ncbi:Oidioi.mRNA.OKI2018_I69.chr1.g3521.t1.cds [Oikopleura dioica]|uniref:Palmitoyltransferase n=1 Tax=Oikopleura dioica TaxID=34765 RepID=A0ABN7SXX1_OIKDI|nr:Oidioi.mRNA.OKI2018_I69.chr1.g3521.t1.cds [Oikopleura dioica]